VIKPGEAWGEARSGPPDLEVTGTDADLARVLGSARGALVRFQADSRSDFARALGINGADAEGGLAEAAVDGLEVDPGGYAINGVVLGVPPGQLRFGTASPRIRVTVNGRELSSGPATTVVVANGQFFDGLDVVPRGHPGDGRFEVQVYALKRGERRAMRTRLPQGSHLPHPRITTGTAKTVEIHVDGAPLALSIDGVSREPVTDLAVRVIPAALRLVL
jgi:YegS C-terminal NAD kinase beta sandwich-like domain